MDMSEQLLQRILTKVEMVDQILVQVNKLEGLYGRFDGLERRMDGLEGRMGSLEGRFDKLEIRFDNQEDRLDTIAIHLVELDEKVSQCATKSELYAVRDEVILYMDGFAKQNETFNQELAASNSRLTRVEEKIGLTL